MDVVASHLHPLLGPMKLQFGTDRVGSEQEDENHQNTWHHGCAQIHIVVGPRIAYLVEVDDDGL